MKLLVEDNAREASLRMLYRLAPGAVVDEKLVRGGFRLGRTFYHPNGAVHILSTGEFGLGECCSHTFLSDSDVSPFEKSLTIYLYRKLFYTRYVDRPLYAFPSPAQDEIIRRLQRLEPQLVARWRVGGIIET